MSLADAPVAHEGFYVTHFLTVKDQAKSREFYVGVLGGKVVKLENPCYIKLANSWIILNSGGGPTPDKPEVILETPPDLNRMSSFLNLRVADVWACYKNWTTKGAHFLTETTATSGDATCAIRMATSSKWASTRRQRSIVSRISPAEGTRNRECEQNDRD